MPIAFTDLENWFTHHPSQSYDQAESYTKIREAGKVFAQVILANTPSSADQTAAIRKVREAVWTANAALACGRK